MSWYYWKIYNHYGDWLNRQGKMKSICFIQKKLKTTNEKVYSLFTFLGNEDTINENRVLAMQWVFFQDWSIDFSQDTVDLVSTAQKSLVLTKGSLAFNFDKRYACFREIETRLNDSLNFRVQSAVSWARFIAWAPVRWVRDDYGQIILFYTYQHVYKHACKLGKYWNSN